MPHKKAAQKPKPKKASTSSSANKSRKLKQTDYKSFKLTKRKKHPGAKLQPARKVFNASIRHLWQYKKLFGGISLVYLLLTFVLVKGFVITGDVTVAKEAIQELIAGTGGQIAASLTAFGVLLNSGGGISDVANTYQSFILITISLVLIWALRQTYAGEPVKVKESFYRATYPLIPFILVILVIGLQLLPLLAANFLYSATIASGTAVSAIEVVLWGLLSFLLALWSLYMITSSLFALYIVTLPDMTPLKALRSARGLVQFRRWTVMRKVLFLPLMLLVLLTIIMLPVIMFVTPVAELLFIILSSLGVAAGHSYMYSLYRELL